MGGRWRGGALAILLATAPCCVRAAEMDNFQLRNAADLVGLCLADPAEPLGNAALNFCQGFVTATFRVLMDVQAALPAPLICLPVPSPNRSDAIAAFSLWAKSASARMASPAEDALLAFLTAQYPCPKPGQ